MKTVFIIHGTGGSPEGNWFPWMKQKLEEKGSRVFVPSFPTPENQSLESWQATFSQYKKFIDHDTIFIAHSVGPSFVCSILEDIDTKIHASYFASGFLGNINIPSFDELNGTFVNREYNWEKIKTRCNNFYMCHGSDDPYVPLHNAQTLADNLGTQIDIIQGGGHLNSDSGYNEFKYLLEKIV